MQSVLVSVVTGRRCYGGKFLPGKTGKSSLIAVLVGLFLPFGGNISRAPLALHQEDSGTHSKFSSVNARFDWSSNRL